MGSVKETGIGKKGGTGFGSNTGGQKPFLPSRDEYSNGGVRNPSLPSGSSSSDDGHSVLSNPDQGGFDHMPKTRPSGLRKG